MKKSIEEITSELNSVGNGFCLAKFTQVTLHLETGLVHSCHHPKTHKIPLEELKKNPAALFNTTILKSARKEMLSGGKPLECEYCWRIEKNNNVSDRIYKSRENWAYKEKDKIVNSTGDEFFKPTYLEVSFGNACNLECSYCGPEFSSKWIESLKAKGPIILNNSDGSFLTQQGWQDLDSLVIPNREQNPYIDAFWKWLPEIYDNLTHYRITGGEPLLNKNTMKSLDYILKNPRPDLDLSINTNLSIPQKLWESFLNKIIEIEKSGNFQRITIFTSVESWGEKAEYSRHGLEFNLLKSRVEELLEKTSVRCTFMATYNILAITSFQQLLEWILALKKKHNLNEKRFTLLDKPIDKKLYKNGYSRVGLDVPYLRHPKFLDVQYCSHELYKQYMIPTLIFMEENTYNTSEMENLGFDFHETDKFRRLLNHRKNFQGDGYNALHYFKQYISALDSRRNTNFLSVFPEMKDFINASTRTS